MKRVEGGIVFAQKLVEPQVNDFMIADKTF